MKTLFIMLGLSCLTLVITAQELKITKVKKGEEPKTVMNAIDRDFPKSISEDLSFLPSKLYGSEWNVDLQGDLSSEVNFYQVKIKQGNTSYTAVYDREGILMSSMQIIESVNLSHAAKETLKKFNGWHIDKTSEIIQYKKRGEKQTMSDTYRVKLQKDAEHKIVFLDLAGNIVNTRFTIF